MRNRMLSLLLAAAASCAAVMHPAGAAEITNQYTYTEAGVYTQVPANTTRIDFEVKGSSGDSSSSGAKGGRGAEITFSLPYGHGYHVGDLLLVFTGKADPATTPIRGGEGGRYIQSVSNNGLAGGSASGVFNLSKHHWLVIAGGGGGAGGTVVEKGGKGGDAGHAGSGGLVLGQPVGGAGGAAAVSCSTPHIPVVICIAQNQPCDAGFRLSHLDSFNWGRGKDGAYPPAQTDIGGGGGGGGGCHGGGGGGIKSPFSGGGGGGGSNYIIRGARHVIQGLAPAGPGSVKLSVTTYSEPPPVITSPGKAAFVVGQPACFDVVGVGRPPPDVHVSGTFPEGTTFQVPLFSGMGKIRGTPTSASIGTHSVAFTMRNDWGTANQTLTIEVVTPEHAPAGANVCHP